MTGVWHRDNPGLYQAEKEAVEARCPNLRFVTEGDVVYVRGSFAVMSEGKDIDRYSVELQLGRDHPKSLPLVREVGGRIPHHSDWHINRHDGTACVLLPDERWRLWPPGTPLLDFLRGPLHSFFLAQSLVEMGEPWPFGQWAHGAQGVFQYYCEILKTTNLRVVTTFLDYIAGKKIKGYWPCPCNSGRRLRDCHFRLVTDLRGKISRKDALNSLRALKEAGASAIETTKPVARV